MPYFQNNFNEDDENNPTQVQLTGASPTTDNDGNINNQQNGSAGKELATGSGFQNIDKYLSTNNSKQFGNEFAGKVQSEVNTAKQNQANAAQQFSDQVRTRNQVPTDEQVSSAIANPTQADQKQFQNWMSQSYQGAKNLAESPDLYNQYWSGTNKANTSAQLMGTEPGRFSLLDSYFGRPNYSFGEKSLDNLLIQQSGVGRQQRDIQNQAAQLKAQGTNTAKNLQDEASKRAGQVEQSTKNVRNAIGVDQEGNIITDSNAQGYGALGQSQKEASDSVGIENAKRQAEYNQALANLGAGKITKGQADLLGLKAGQKIYNLDLTKYLNKGEDLNLAQTMSPEQRARIAALSDLAGVADTFTPSVQDKTNPYSFKTAEMNSDVAKLQPLIRGMKAAALYNQNNQFFNELARDYGYNPNDMDDINRPGIAEAVDRMFSQLPTYLQEPVLANYNQNRLLQVEGEAMPPLAAYIPPPPPPPPPPPTQTIDIPIVGPIEIPIQEPPPPGPEPTLEDLFPGWFT